jgi:hypothetical protein
MKLSEKSLIRRLTVFNATLGELPRILANSSCPQNLSLIVCDDYAYIWSESIIINQTRTSQYSENHCA